MGAKFNAKGRNSVRDRRKKRQILRRSFRKQVPETSDSLDISVPAACARGKESLLSSSSANNQAVILCRSTKRKSNFVSDSNSNEPKTVLVNVPVTAHHRRALRSCPSTAINVSAKRLKRLAQRKRRMLESSSEENPKPSCDSMDCSGSDDVDVDVEIKVEITLSPPVPGRTGTVLGVPKF